MALNIPTIPNTNLGLNNPAQLEVNGLWYKDKELNIDGWRFVSCRFDNCRLNLSTPDFEFINCLIDSSCTVMFYGNIVTVFQLFNRDNDWMRQTYPNFAATKNPDGTISIRA